MRYPSQLDLNIGILVVLSKFIPYQHDNDKVISVADLKLEQLLVIHIIYSACRFDVVIKNVL